MLYILYIFIFLFYTQYWFTKDLQILSHKYVWLDDGILIMLFLYTFIKNNFRLKTRINTWVFLFIFYGIFASIINNSFLTLNTILGIKYFILPILIFILLVIMILPIVTWLTI